MQPSTTKTKKYIVSTLGKTIAVDEQQSVAFPNRVALLQSEKTSEQKLHPLKKLEKVLSDKELYPRDTWKPPEKVTEFQDDDSIEQLLRDSSISSVATSTLNEEGKIDKCLEEIRTNRTDLHLQVQNWMYLMKLFDESKALQVVILEQNVCLLLPQILTVNTKHPAVVEVCVRFVRNIMVLDRERTQDFLNHSILILFRELLAFQPSKNSSRAIFEIFKTLQFLFDPNCFTPEQITAHRKRLEKVKIFKRAVHAFTTLYARYPRLVRAAFDFCRLAIVNDAVLLQEFAGALGIKQSSIPAKIHQDDRAVIASYVQLMYALMKDSPENRNELSLHHFNIEIMFPSFVFCIPEFESALAWLHCIRYLAQDQGGRARLGRAGVMILLCGMINPTEAAKFTEGKTPQQIQELELVTLYAINNITVESIDNVSTAVQRNAPNLVLRVLQNNPNNIQMHSAGCRLARNLVDCSIDQDIGTKVFTNDYALVTVSAMENFMNEYDLWRYGCYLFNTVLERNPLALQLHVLDLLAPVLDKFIKSNSGHFNANNQAALAAAQTTRDMVKGARKTKKAGLLKKKMSLQTGGGAASPANLKKKGSLFSPKSSSIRPTFSSPFTSPRGSNQISQKPSVSSPFTSPLSSPR